MKQVSGKDFCRILARHGWTLLRVNGSHHIHGRPGSIVRPSVPVDRNHPLKVGLLKHLLTQTGLTEEDM